MSAFLDSTSIGTELIGTTTIPFSSVLLAALCGSPEDPYFTPGESPVCDPFYAQMTPPNPPAISPPPAPSGDVLGQTPDQAINDIVNSGIQQSQANEQGFFNSLPPVGQSGFPWYVWALLIGGGIVAVKFISGRF